MKSNFLKDNNNLFLSKKETKVIFFPMILQIYMILWKGDDK